MKTIYYDCFAGISGDMNLGAMVDLGADKDALVSELEKLGIGGWKIEFSKDGRGGIFGTKAQVVLDGHEHTHDASHPHAHEHADCEHHHEHAHAECPVHEHAHTHEHRSFRDIKAIIENSKISDRAKKLSLKIFGKVAEAEAKIHGREIDDVCFHEVGAVDSIIDIVGAAICADLLGAEKFACSEIELGGGTVKCAHGIIPVPAPATAEILKNFRVKLNGAPHECTTPTGAAIIAALCEVSEAKISGRIVANGVGVGQRNPANIANVLRVSLIESAPETDGVREEKMFVAEANIDDMTAESLAFLCSRLFAEGAADVWQEAIAMKKSRLGTKVCALVSEECKGKILSCFLGESSTLGVRVSEVSRISIPRETRTIKTRLGEVRVKISEFGGRAKIKPEFDDCASIANKKHLPLDEVRRIAENESEI